MRFYWRMIPNYARSLYRRARVRLKGLPVEVDIRTFQQRLVACFTCDAYDKRHLQCTLCGCPVVDKAKYTTEICPHKQGSKWPK